MTILLTKYKAYRDYKPSGVEWLRVIPSHWDVSRLRNSVLSWQNGVWGDEPSGNNDIACVRVADFDRVSLIANMDKPTFRSIETRLILTRKLLSGDLLLEVSGGGEKQPVGTVVLYDSNQPAVCSNFVARLRPSDGHESRFLAYLHFTLYVTRVNLPSIKQNTGIQNLDKASYLNETVAFPPLPEQRAIAAFLDRETAKIDTLIAKKERLIELLQEKRTALISRAVTKGLDPDVPMKDSGVEWLGEIPAHWEVRRLKSISEIRYGLGQPPRESSDGLPLIRATNVNSGHITDVGMVYIDPLDVPSGRRAFLSKHEIIVVRSGAYTADSSIVPRRYEGAVAGYDMVVTARRANPEFLATALLCPYVRDAQLVVASTRSAQPHLNAEELGEALILLPPLSEQQSIAGFLGSETPKLDALIVKIREAIEHLKELRAALISAAVTGRIDVREEAEVQS